MHLRKEDAYNYFTCEMKLQSFTVLLRHEVQENNRSGLELDPFDYSLWEILQEIRTYETVRVLLT